MQPILSWPVRLREGLDGNVRVGHITYTPEGMLFEQMFPAHTLFQPWGSIRSAEFRRRYLRPNQVIFIRPGAPVLVVTVLRSGGARELYILAVRAIPKD